MKVWWPIGGLLTCIQALAEPLPEGVDHSSSTHFPPIIRQRLESCAQDAGISYLLTYEWNRTHGTSAADPRNQWAGTFLWHFLNRGENRGAEVVEGWQLANTLGVPSVASYRPPRNLGTWPHGYALYYEGMQRRLQGYRSFPIKSLEDIARLKAWLYHRGDAHEKPGSLFVVESRLEGATTHTPAGATYPLITKWGREGKGHVMTYVGYDDTVKHDLNEDGQITTTVDINNDGRITLADCEQGAFLVVNSHGLSWGHQGRAHVLYAAFAQTNFRRGQWAAAAKVRPRHQPLLTLKLQIQGNCQDAMRVALHADDTVYRPWIFTGKREVALAQPASPEKYSRFLTGARRLSLGPFHPQNQPLEIGIDLTGKVSLHARTYRLVMSLDTDRYPHATGIILQAALRRYDPVSGDCLSETSISTETPR